jgi:tRNA(fMet)-specific endonuclease VapC
LFNYLEKLKKLVETYIPVVMPTQEIAQQYAIIRSFLEKKGLPIGNNDLWIAAHALSLNAILVTNNTREFSRVPDLVIEDWVNSEANR